jgi:hypothetical protein
MFIALCLVLATAVAADPNPEPLEAHELPESGICLSVPAGWTSLNGSLIGGRQDTLTPLPIYANWKGALEIVSMQGMRGEVEPIPIEQIGGRRAAAVRGTGKGRRRVPFGILMVDLPAGPVMVQAQGDWDWMRSAQTVRECAERPQAQWRFRPPKGMRTLEAFADRSGWIGQDDHSMLQVYVGAGPTIHEILKDQETADTPMELTEARLGRWRALGIEKEDGDRRMGLYEIVVGDRRAQLMVMVEPGSDVDFKTLRRSLRRFRFGAAPHANSAEGNTAP